MPGFRTLPDRLEFLKGLSFKPSQRLLCSRFGKRWSKRFPWEWCWRMLAMGMARQFRAALTQLGLQYVVGIESIDHGLGTGTTTLASASAKTRPWSAAQTPTAHRRSSAHFGKAVGPRFAVFGLEGDRLAPRQSENFAFSFRRCPRASRASRLQAHRTPPGRMALDRMAEERIGTHQILALHVAGEDLPEVSGEDRQTPLDHRTRL